MLQRKVEQGWRKENELAEPQRAADAEQGAGKSNPADSDSADQCPEAREDECRRDGARQLAAAEPQMQTACSQKNGGQQRGAGAAGHAQRHSIHQPHRDGCEGDDRQAAREHQPRHIVPNS